MIIIITTNIAEQNSYFILECFSSNTTFIAITLLSLLIFMTNVNIEIFPECTVCSNTKYFIHTDSELNGIFRKDIVDTEARVLSIFSKF